MKISSVVSMLCLLALSAPALALTRKEAKDLIRALPSEYIDISDHGLLCEVLGLAVMKEQRPDARIYHSIVYKKKNRVIGELDLVIAENNVVTDVIEVKCMKSYKSASNKADKQLERFAGYIGSCDVDFSTEGVPVPCDIFGSSNIHLGKMSYTDASASGFDFDLSFTRAEIISMIREVQNEGRDQGSAEDEERPIAPNDSKEAPLSNPSTP